MSGNTDLLVSIVCGGPSCEMCGAVSRRESPEPRHGTPMMTRAGRQDGRSRVDVLLAGHGDWARTGEAYTHARDTLKRTAAPSPRYMETKDKHSERVITLGQRRIARLGSPIECRAFFASERESWRPAR